MRKRECSWLVAAAVLALASVCWAESGFRTEWREETDNKGEIRPWGVSGMESKSGLERSTRVLGQIRGSCDGTCNSGKPCICPEDCPCRKPPICASHYLEIDRNQVNKAISSIVESLSSRFGGSVGANVAAKMASDISVSGDVAEGVKGSAGAHDEKSGSGSAKAEGSKSSEKTEKSESESSLSLTGKICIGMKDHASAGVRLEVFGRATLEVVTEIIRTKEFSSSILGRTWSTTTRSGGSTSIGIIVENEVNSILCPCRSRKAGDGSSSAEGKEKVPAEKGVYLGGSDKESYIAIREDKPPETATGRTYEVRVRGCETGRDDYRAASGKKDPSITVLRVRHSPDASMGATITVVDPSGKSHEVDRPPDRISITNKVTVSRGGKSTTVTVSPEVRKQSPDGNETVSGPNDSPSGSPPSVYLKGDRGFWGEVGDFLNKVIPGVLVNVGTGFVLNRSAGGGSAGGGGAVRSNPDGSTSIEIPNDVFDPALTNARKSNPDFGPGEVAGSIETGIGVSEGANPLPAPSIVSYNVIGGSPTEMQSGSEVVFMVRHGQGSGAPGRASLSVILESGGAVVGFMKVKSVSDAGGGICAVCAVLDQVPTGLETFDGRVRAGEKQTNAVPFHVAEDAVDLTAVQKIVTEGNIVTFVLRSPSGGAIRGTLSITGPGVILPERTMSVEVDSAGSVAYQVETSDPGLINATFTPSKPGKSGDMERVMQQAGIEMDELRMD